MTAMEIAMVFSNLPTATALITHCTFITIAALRFRNAVVSERKRGQGLSSEPAFDGSSDGTRGRDDEMEARAQLSSPLLGVPVDRASSLSAASRQCLLSSTWLQGVDAVNHVLHTIQVMLDLHLIVARVAVVAVVCFIIIAGPSFSSPRLGFRVAGKSLRSFWSCEQSRDRLDVWFSDVVPLVTLFRREIMYLCTCEGRLC